MKITDFVKSYQNKIELGLERVSALLEELSNPEKDLKVIHVTGTNGKGSVCAYLEKMLIADGFKTGLFSSPELVEKCEQIRLSGKNISEEKLDELIKSTKTACEKVLERKGSYPSQFEILTAVAFMYFKEEKVDFAILEVGMGGEGDATNVIKNTALSIITKISLDHMAYLGDSIEKIARVKSGIIKKGSKVVTCEENRDVLDIIKEKCDGKNAKLFVSKTPLPSGFSEIYEKLSFSGEEITLSLGGINQLCNAAIAIEAAKVLGLSEKSIKAGLETATHKGRFEKIRDNFYFDGAHNKDGAEALNKSLNRYFKDKKISFLMASMKDKDVRGAISTLNGEKSKFFFYTANVPERAMEASEIKKIADSVGAKGEAFLSLKEAYEAALKEESIIIASGSLYTYKDFIKEDIF